MRKFIEAVTLLEGIDLHPAVLTVHDGQSYVGWPEGTTEQVETPCEGCNGTGKCPHGDDAVCDDCFGTGVWKDTKYNLPNIRMTNEGLQIILDILGMEFDYAGWIAPDQLADLRRQLIRLLNTDNSAHTREPHVHQRVGYDNSEEVARITRGPKIHTPGVTNTMIEDMLRRIIDVIDYSQKGGYGLSWG